jgi:transposase
MRKIREVLRLHLVHGCSRQRISQSVGIARSTVSEYLYRSEAAGLSWPLPEGLSDEDLGRLLFSPTDKTAEVPRSAPNWAELHAERSRRGVTLLLLWKEYRQASPDGYGYSRFVDLYNAWKDSTELRMLQHHAPGEKLFVDFAGLTMPVSDALSGQVRQVQVFCSAMGASHRLFARATHSQSVQDWLGVLEHALSFYGALPQVLVPDNLKAAVKRADRYEPELNPSFAEFAQHYGMAVVPARPRKPRDKAKVENAVLQTERWILAPLRNRVFFSLQELNEAIAQQLEEFDCRIMKGPAKSRRELFEQLDLPAMRPLPDCRYRFAQWKAAKVGPDYHVEFEGHRYSVPYGLRGKPVAIRADEFGLELFSCGRRVCAHRRSYLGRGFSTEPSHMPKAHREFADWTPERIERWAAETGENTARLVAGIIESRVYAQTAFRPCLGVISLGDRYGKERLEAACARAVSYGAYSYQAVKTMLAKGLDAQEPAETPVPTTTLHANLRGADYYKEKSPCAN